MQSESIISSPSNSTPSSFEFTTMDKASSSLPSSVRTARRQPRSVKPVEQPEPKSGEVDYYGKLTNVDKFGKDEDEEEKIRNKVDMSAGEVYRTIEKSLEE